MASPQSSLPSQHQPNQGSPESPAADWADLPPDLVATICKRLHDLFDFVYFRAVCKNWRRVTSISDLPPLIPWILEQQDSEHLRFYSLISGKTRTIRCLSARGKALWGPSHGYLYATSICSGDEQHASATCLLNPLTNDHNEIIKIPKPFDNFYMNCVSPDPMGDGHVGFIDHDDYFPQMMAFHQPRTKHWSFVNLRDLGPKVRYACLKRMCYIHDSNTGNTVVVDVARGKGSSFTVPSPDNLNLDISEDLFFVESGGKILRIIKRMEPDSGSSRSRWSFDVYQLDGVDRNRDYNWVKNSTISNQVLFLEGGHGISVAAYETAGLRGNCIYFFEMYRGDSSQSSGEYELYKYNIEDGQTETIRSHFKHKGTWFMPRITVPS